MSNEQFIFRKHDKIGVNDAAEDTQTLLDCFVDTGDYDLLEKLKSPERFVLGRTGSGKTALITMLKNEKPNNTIVIEPESLALNHITNSNILKTISDLGVNLDIFYKLLWRHVLSVEIFKRNFNLTNEYESRTFIDRLKSKFNRNKTYLRFVEYLAEWGDAFWESTDTRVKQITKKIESDVEGSVSAKVSSLGAKLSGKTKFSEEEKREVRQISQEVVNSVQMKVMTDLINMVDEIIDDRQKSYYIIIDKLDENWVEDELRYKLIKALLQTVRDFNVVQSVKIVVVIRIDLLDRVYEFTRDQGFQEEKFSSLYLPIKWTKSQLTEVLNKRIDHLVKQRYTTKKVTYSDLLPDKIDDIPVIDWMLMRTLMRPRDVIQFFNLCIQEAIESPSITKDMLVRAEREYSVNRFDSLQDEWQVEYPRIRSWTSLLEATEKEFLVADIDDKAVADFAMKYIDEVDLSQAENDKLYALACKHLEDKIDSQTLRNQLINNFYTIGLLGIQPKGHNSPLWSYEQRRKIKNIDISPDTIIQVHPCYWSALGTKV